MKKVLLPVLLVSAIIFANAKERKTSGSPHAIGIRVGLTTPTLLGGGDLPSGISKSVTTGFVAGLVYSYYFSEIFSFQPELLFIQGGYILKSESTLFGTTYSSTENATWGYVQVPILFKARFGSEAFKFTLHAGPYIGFATGGKAKSKTEIAGSTQETESDIKVEKNGLAAIDLGAALGAGVNIKAGPGQIIADLRFNIGFTDVEDRDPKPSGYKSSTNLIPSLSVGYLYPLGK